MKILHITAQKPDSTGSGTYLAQLVGACQRAGHTQAVVCGVDKADNPQLPANVAVHTVRFQTEEVPFPVCGMSDEMPYTSTRYRDMTPAMVDQFKTAFSATVLAAAKDLQPDLVICNHLYLLTALVRNLLPHVPVFGICHSTCLRQLQQQPLERDYILEAIPRLDGILALHRDQAASICQLFQVGEDHVRIIGTGYDASCFKQDNSGNRPTDLVYVGKISFKKGVLSLIHALNLVPADTPLQVHLVGGAGNTAEWETISAAAQSCPHNVLLLGKVSQEQLVREYQQAKTFVLPSFYEGLPLVTIEAMACGANVVVTDLPGVRPWLSANLPDAPIDYVSLPRIINVDQPLEEDLPAFEQRLAQAIQYNLARPALATSTTHLSWDALAARVLAR